MFSFSQFILKLFVERVQMYVVYCKYDGALVSIKMNQSLLSDQFTHNIFAFASHGEFIIHYCFEK